MYSLRTLELADPRALDKIARARAAVRAHVWSMIGATLAGFPWLQIAGKLLAGWLAGHRPGRDADHRAFAKNRIHPQEAELGRFWSPEPANGAPQVKCYARRWRDSLDENRRRLDFLTSAMQHDPSLKEGLDYVKRRYADVLPPGIGETLSDEED